MKSISLVQTADTSYRYEVEGFFWFDFFAIFLNVVVPIALLVLTFYIIFKFHKVLKKISTSLEEINKTLKNK